MPFTFAHPLAVLPFLKKKYFSATGLVVGSIAPDFEYFLKMKAGSIHSHNILGMFYFDLPLSFLLAFCFHEIVKEPVLQNCPSFVQNRLFVLRNFTFLNYLKKHYWVFTYSAILGLSTHLAWDSFTHAGGYMVSVLPILTKTYVHFLGVNYPLWYSLQHIFSVLGLAILALYFISLPTYSVKTEKPSGFFWLLIILVAAIAFSLRYWYGDFMNYGNKIVAIISALLFGILLISIMTKIKIVVFSK